jgi:pimeloyl-ACP methyl ester carboxylesterase
MHAPAHEPKVDADSAAYVGHVFHAQDDLTIYYREYGDDRSSATPLLCLSGLTRNSHDFDRLARRLSPSRRVLAMDYRGRGRSGYDPDWRHYEARTYISDVLHLLAVAGVQRVVVLGTSLGGLIAMALGAAAPSLLAGVILNDVGPVVASEGRDRIAAYVGKELRVASLDVGADLLTRQFESGYPGLPREGWLDYARGTFVFDPARGDYRLDYDLKIGDALREQVNGEIPDLWPLFRTLRHIPVLVLRGALSDVLDPATFARMAAEKPDLIRITVPDRGHVPLLDEPESLKAIDEFLARF